VGVLSLLLASVCSTCVHCSRLSDNCTWSERILSLEHRRRNETKKYHCAQQSPHDNDWLPRNENVHARTSGDEERLPVAVIILRNAPDFSWTSCQRLVAPEPIYNQP
jgi:hypothetical protein